jgi:hypothetical protein
MTRSYNLHNGKHQDIFDKYEAINDYKGEENHMWLMIWSLRIYYRFLNDGDENWYYLAGNHGIGIPINYKPPKDAPIVVQNFYSDIKNDIDVAEKYFHDLDSGLLDDDEIVELNDIRNINHFTIEDLDDLLDHVLLYVDRVEKAKQK